MKTVKRINVLSMAKLHALALSLIGVVAGCIYAFGGFAIDAFVSLGWMTSQETPGLSYGTILALFALIGMPAIAAAIGFFLGLIVALLFNIVVWFLGGIELDL
jgi:hypothetical protein